jgi:hypothetical protein
VEPFLDSPDPAIATRGDYLLPLSHWLPRHARVIAADIAALRTREELLGCCRDVSEARIMHGLSQAQGVICNLRPNRGSKHVWREVEFNTTLCTHTHFLLAKALREATPSRVSVSCSLSFQVEAMVAMVLAAWAQRQSQGPK